MSNYSRYLVPIIFALASLGAQAQTTVQLVAGWNLIGLGNTATLSVADANLFGDANKVTTVWKWLPSDSKWAFYAPSMTSQALSDYATGKGYGVLATIAGSDGFWVNAKTPFSVSLPTGSAVLSSSFLQSGLPAGWSLLAIGETKTPIEFNRLLSATAYVSGDEPGNVTTLWAWDSSRSLWYFYAPSLKNSNGLAAYIQDKGYLDFTTANKTLGTGVGFWINKATATAAVDSATVTAPVVNTPLKGVSVTLTCANGTVGGTGTAADGSVSIAVPVTCLPPYTMAVSGKGTMAGPDLKFGTDDDETYDSSKRAALKSVIQSTDLGLTTGAPLTKGTSVTAPSITSLTTMVAEKLAKPNPSAAEIDAAMTAVAGVTGLPMADLYKNPMTNGEVFKAATLVNEMVASAMKADPTKIPADLLKSMASSTTAKLTDATIDTAAMMGMSAANNAIMQAQMATMQAKAGAMKSVADAVVANIGSASQATVTPAAAAGFLSTALSGAQASDAQTMIAKAKMAQDSMQQMFEQMDKLRADTTIAPADLAGKMAAMAQGLDAVRVKQEGGIQASIVAAGGDPAKIADAMKQASGMIIGAAPALLTSVTGASVAQLQTSGFMSAAAGSITANMDPVKMAAAVATAGGDPSKIDFGSMGLNPTTMATNATAAGTQATGVNLTPPSNPALTALASQIVGMVINRAVERNWMTSTQLQAWVNAIGNALAGNAVATLNPGSVSATLGDFFSTKNPDFTKAPGTLTLTVAATGPTFTVPTSGTTVTLPLCPELLTRNPPVSPIVGVNCRPQA